MEKMLNHIGLVFKDHFKQISIHKATKVLKKNMAVDTQYNMYAISKQISRRKTS